MAHEEQHSDEALSAGPYLLVALPHDADFVMKSAHMRAQYANAIEANVES